MNTHAALLVIIMAAATMLLRFLPFLVFRKEVPPYITYLGEVLPAAIIGMLGVDCLNLFGISNVNSYYWVSDVNNRQWAVPNYLTGRQINGKVTIDF